jgi:hypothetical protein
MSELQKFFTEEEIAIIKRCVDLGLFDHIMPALDTESMQEMTPEKERALGDYIKQVKPVILDEDSAVRAELQKLQLEGYELDTPEKESEWQAKLDAERAEKEAKIKGETVTVAVVADELTKEQIMAELTEKGIKFSQLQKKSELFDLLNNSVKE